MDVGQGFGPAAGLPAGTERGKPALSCCIVHADFKLSFTEMMGLTLLSVNLATFPEAQ
jgi:hypothetical protein